MLTLVEVCELKCRGNICQFALLMISLSSQMKKLETKMATMNEEKDKRIVELQAHNNDLFNKLEEFEERYNNQLDVSRSFLFLLQRLYFHPNHAHSKYIFENTLYGCNIYSLLH